MTRATSPRCASRFDIARLRSDTSSDRAEAKTIEAYYETRGGLVLGAMEGNRLRGYVTVHAAGDSAYIEEVHLASDALDTQIGPGLTHQAALACTRNPDIRHLIHSLVTPERPGLTRFKQQMGFRIVEVPARYWMAPGFRQLLERFHPNAYYRFTGHGRPAPAGENVED